jgi:hypothetical protein
MAHVYGRTATKCALTGCWLSAADILSTVKLLMNITQALVGDVRVDLGGGDIFVPEQLLDGAQISAVPEQVCGVGMAQRMRSNFF